MHDFRTDSEHIPPHDELDQMLRQWHDENNESARAGRDRLLRALARRESVQTAAPSSASPVHRGGPAIHPRPSLAFVWLRAIFFSTYTRAAAALVLVAFLALLTLPRSVRQASAQVIQVAEGGKLEALDDAGNLLGPCPLIHTDVHVEIAGLFSRTTVRQHYENPYDVKIEAVYTFPLSHRAAVDRMRMIIDEDRIVEGEVREREEARRIYEQAKAANHVAALLEQERPNIFTQSVANIEPGAAIEIEISYLETVESKDGVFTVAFPMTVAPRYIPGSSTVSPALTPAELELRGGVIRLGPAQIEVLPLEIEGEAPEIQIVGGGQVEALLSAARSIHRPGASWWGVDEETGRMNVPPVLAQFKATYCDGTAEVGVLLRDGTGHLGGRWFFTDPDIAKSLGTGFEQNTNQVPDASRITPMPTRPPTRAGHDISLTVTIDTGGPAITLIESELHEIESDFNPEDSRARIELTNQREIPNRDFVLHWKQEDDQIEEATFIHVDERGGFFTLILQPPARVDPDLIRTRELIFVLDTSGSMRGQPIEKAKSVLTRAIDRMRAGDTFNIITFAGNTDILWNQPRANSEKNRAEALRWVNVQQGSGGTEMMQAIDAALRGGPAFRAEAIPEPPLQPGELANLPADGRDVVVQVGGERFTLLAAPSDFVNTRDGITYGNDGVISIKGPFEFPSLADDAEWRLTGRWITEDGGRWLDVQAVELVAGRDGSQTSADPMRIVMFLTDGEVGNDEAIIAAVKKYAKSTRVFSFGIGNSVNRFLLANMAHAARGEVEFVTQQSDPDLAVERFVTRIDAPVLTDITLEFSEGLAVSDLMPVNPAGLIPDLFDVRPLIIHGRFDPEQGQTGTLTIRGRTGAGAYERAIDLDLRNRAKHDQLPTLWARAKVDHLMNADLTRVQLGNPPAEMRNQIVALGVEYQIMSRYTSFIAVEKSRVTIDGRPMLVAVPIELPSDADWSGFFGPAGEVNDDVIELTLRDLSLGLSVALVPEPVEKVARLRTVTESGGSAVYLSETDRVEQVQQQGQDRQHQLETQERREAPQRQQQINQNLRRVRELQLERRYSEAVQVIDQILFLDDANPSALALRDAMQAAALWQSYIANADERAREGFHTYQFEENRRASNAPMPNFGPGAKSTTGLMPYPEDWPSLSLRDVSFGRQVLNTNSASAAVFFDGQQGRRTVPLLGDIPVMGELFMEVDGATRAGLNFGTAAGSDDSVFDELAMFSFAASIPFGRAGNERFDIADADSDVGGVQANNFLTKDKVTRRRLALVDAAAGAFEGVIQLSNGEAVTFQGGAGGFAQSTNLGREVEISFPWQLERVEWDSRQWGRSPDDLAALAEARAVQPVFSLNEFFDSEGKLLTKRNPFVSFLPPGDEQTVETEEADRRAAEAVAQMKSDPEFEQFVDELNVEEGERETNQQLQGETLEPAAPQTVDPIAILRGRIERIAHAPEDQLRAPRLFYLFEPRGGFYRERVAMIVGGLAGDGHVEIASRIAEWLVELDPTFTIATEMQTILHDDALAEDQRTAQIAELAARARRVIEDAVRQAVTLQALAERVHPDLLALLVAEDHDEAAPVAVTILVETADNAMLGRLRDHGLRVRGSSLAGGLVVGETARDDLRRIALLPGVRRINPADLKPAE